MENIINILPRIIELTEKKLIGIHISMSLAANKTGVLWQTFMPRRNEILNNKSSDLISLQIYSENHFSAFSIHNEFEKWACVEVENYKNIPHGMDTLMLEPCTYAVFDYKGLNTDHRIFEYIYSTWLPSSGYVLNNSPHFEVLGEKYKNNDPTSEEQIWIPIVKIS